MVVFLFLCNAMFTAYKSQHVLSLITSKGVCHLLAILSQPPRPWEFLREACKGLRATKTIASLHLLSQLRARRFKIPRPPLS